MIVGNGKYTDVSRAKDCNKKFGANDNMITQSLGLKTGISKKGKRYHMIMTAVITLYTASRNLE